MRNDSLKKIAEALREAESVTIFPHINMDGDTLGSSAALCLALRKMGKKAYIIIDEAVPDNLDFLEYGCSVNDHQIIPEPDAAVMVDCGSMGRIEGREDAFMSAGKRICVDHHAVSEARADFDLSRVEADSAATGEMVYLLIKELGCGVDLSIAECIFAAVTTDTGNFQHSNTTGRSHMIAAELYDVDGFDSKKISSLIYDRNSFASMKLSAMIIERAEFHENGQIAFGTVSQEDLRETGCLMSETDGLIQRIMSIRGVEVAVLFKETEQGDYKLSMRAKSFVDVGAVAFRFGGGGHVRAAGCTMKMPLADAEKLMADALRDEMGKTGK